MSKGKKKNYVNYIILLSIFIIMFVWNLTTPLWLDDLYSKSNHVDILGMIQASKNDYFTWNGRVFGQFFMRFLAALNGWRAAFLNAGAFTLYIFLIVRLSLNKKSRDIGYMRYIIAICLVILFIPVFGQVFLWRAGAGNYLWPLTLNLLLVYIVIIKDELLNFNIIGLIITLPVAFVAGWSNENTSGGTILMLIIFLMIDYFENKKINVRKVVVLCVTLCGYIFLLLSPSSKIRIIAQYGEQYYDTPMLIRTIKGIATLSNVLLNQYVVLIIVTVIVCMLSYQKNLVDKNQYLIGWIFIFSGIATIYALSLGSEIGQDGGRSFFGAITYIIIGLLCHIPNWSGFTRMTDNNAIFHIGVVLLVIFASLNIFIGIVDSYRTNMAIQKRYEFIEKNLVDKNQYLIGWIFIFSGIATIYALSLGSEIGQDGGRSFFGAITYIIIGLLCHIPNWSGFTRMTDNNAIFHIGVVLLVIFASLNIFIGIVDSYRTNMAIQKRYEFIEKKIEHGKKLVYVDPLSYTGSTKYSITYGNAGDVNPDNPDLFPNMGYTYAYKIKVLLKK